jgi:hypothetical protein
LSELLRGEKSYDYVDRRLLYRGVGQNISTPKETKRPTEKTLTQTKAKERERNLQNTSAHVIPSYPAIPNKNHYQYQTSRSFYQARTISSDGEGLSEGSPFVAPAVTVRRANGEGE